MPKSVDLTGKRFGRLVAIEPTKERSYKNVVWKCKCDCGNYKNVSVSNLKLGRVKSCGCIRNETLDKFHNDIKGKRFGRLTVIEPLNQKNKRGNIVWKCECDCGNVVYVRRDLLSRGESNSCGCLRSEIYSNIAKNNIKNAYEIFGLHDGTMECRLNDTISKNNSTGVRGVCEKNGRFQAYITYKRKRYHLGTFWTLKDAKEARKIAEKKIWGKELE